MKGVVLSRGRSHASKDMGNPVPKGMARGGIGTAQWGKAALKPVLSSSPGILGGFVPGQG